MTLLKLFLRLLKNINKLNKYEVPYKILNIGTSKSEKLLRFVNLIEKNLNKNAKKFIYQFSKVTQTLQKQI